MENNFDEMEVTELAEETVDGGTKKGAVIALATAGILGIGAIAYKGAKVVAGKIKTKKEPQETKSEVLETDDEIVEVQNYESSEER